MTETIVKQSRRIENEITSKDDVVCSKRAKYHLVRNRQRNCVVEKANTFILGQKYEWTYIEEEAIDRD